MQKALNKNRNVDMVIHLGDCVGDILKLQKLFESISFEFVSGNNDWSREYPREKTLELEGKKIFITHGHMYNVKYDYQRIAARGRAINADAVFFGHTHEPEEFFSEGMLVLNPGSIGGTASSSGRPVYCTVEITSERIISHFQSI
jgi:phosphoesterase, MJ0936 family